MGKCFPSKITCRRGKKAVEQRNNKASASQTPNLELCVCSPNLQWQATRHCITERQISPESSRLSASMNNSTTFRVEPHPHTFPTSTPAPSPQRRRRRRSSPRHNRPLPQPSPALRPRNHKPKIPPRIPRHQPPHHGHQHITQHPPRQPSLRYQRHVGAVRGVGVGVPGPEDEGAGDVF